MFQKTEWNYKKYPLFYRLKKIEANKLEIQVFFFALYCTFLKPIIYSHWTGSCFSTSGFFSGTSAYQSKRSARKPAKLWRKSLFHGCCSHGTIIQGQPLKKKHFPISFLFANCSLLGRQLAVQESTSRVNSGCGLYTTRCCPVHPTPSHIPQGACLDLAGCGWL